MAPLHLEARLALSTLQQQLGRPDSALEALEPMYDPDTLAQDSSAAQQVCVPAHSRLCFSCAVPNTVYLLCLQKKNHKEHIGLTLKCWTQL